MHIDVDVDIETTTSIAHKITRINMSATKGRTALALTRVWHHASASDRTLGNIASRIAWVLMGKHKPTYDPAVDAGDYVVVSDALKVHLSGKKSTDKMYYSHTGYMGGLKAVPITRLRERRPEEIIRRAVSGMLPKNTFRDRRLERLKIFPGAAPDVYLSNALTTWRDTVPASTSTPTTTTTDSSVAHPQ